MGYSLGDVKPWVRAAADYFGPAHNISTVGGWRAHGSVPNSDHPKGLALDFMTRSKATGDQLAADVLRNAQAWNVKYVIWYREIWSPGKGWRPYSGPSPHTDHVHVSFNATGKIPDRTNLPFIPGGGLKMPDIPGLGGAAGGVLDPLGVAGAISKVGDQLGALAGSVASVAKVADMITRAFLPTNVVRGAAGFSGAIFVLIGIWFLSREIRNS